MLTAKPYEPPFVQDNLRMNRLERRQSILMWMLCMQWFGFGFIVLTPLGNEVLYLILLFLVEWKGS